MSLKDPNAPSYVTECTIHTEVNTKMAELRLIVENVSQLSNVTKIIERTFYPTPDWICNVSFGKDRFFYLHISNKSDIEVNVMVKGIFYNCNKEILHEIDDEIHILEKDEEINLLDGVDDAFVDFDHLPYDKLIIDLNVLSLPEKEAGLFLCDTDSERKLREDYKTMLENPVNPDVFLRIGEEQIPAHWAILCSRSQYFKNMYESQMQESFRNHVTITDISVTTLKHLISFLYSACFFENSNLDIDQLFELYFAADRYEVMDLRRLCARKVMNNASIDNVWRIWQLAHRHTDKELKTQAMEFIVVHWETCFFENSNGDMEQLFELYSEADRYDVKDLRALCARKIMHNASIDNVWRIFLLAQRHFDKELKTKAMEFIDVHWEESLVLELDSWKQFEANEPFSADFIKFFLQK